MQNFKNKNFIISGATSGIGKELVLQLAKQGARIAFCGRSSQRMEELHSELGVDYNDDQFSDVFCLSETERIVSFVKQAVDKYKTIDYVINCAGLNSAKG